MTSPDTTHRQFFGDAERDFCITPAMIPELERKTATGIGGLCRRLFAGDFYRADINEVIRLALIGGGENPQRAAELVETYAAPGPLIESHILAVAIMERLWFGAKAKEGEGNGSN